MTQLIGSVQHDDTKRGVLKDHTCSDFGLSRQQALVNHPVHCLNHAGETYEASCMQLP